MATGAICVQLLQLAYSLLEVKRNFATFYEYLRHLKNGTEKEKYLYSVLQ